VAAVCQRRAFDSRSIHARRLVVQGIPGVRLAPLQSKLSGTFVHMQQKNPAPPPDAVDEAARPEDRQLRRCAPAASATWLPARAQAAACTSLRRARSGADGMNGLPAWACYSARYNQVRSGLPLHQGIGRLWDQHLWAMDAVRSIR
jgi:hypothetical protein